MSSFRLLLKDVDLSIVERIKPVQNPTYTDAFVALNADQFQIHIPNIANIGAYNGTKIQIEVLGELEQSTIELYLNGSVLGALLMQRQQLALHGSSVSHKEKAILFCGESGSGKSTLTFGFSQEEDFEFLTDDISPLHVEGKNVMVRGISEQLKLWDDTLDQFNVKSSNLIQVRPEINKFFFQSKGNNKLVPLNYIFFLDIGDSDDMEIKKIDGSIALTELIKNVYRKEFLAGLPETEVHFFRQHTVIAENVHCFKLTRPKNSTPKKLMDKIRIIINK